MTLDEIIPKMNNIMHTVPRPEQEVLYNEAAKITSGVIVDIGTCDGGSAFIMALASPTSQVWTMDPNVGPRFLEKRKELGLEDRVHFIPKGSNEAILDWDKKIDLLFIDGVHNSGAIETDINNWAAFSKVGSIVLLHDYFWYGNNVQSAIDRANIKLKLLDTPYGFHDTKKVGIAITERI